MELLILELLESEKLPKWVKVTTVSIISLLYFGIVCLFAYLLIKNLGSDMFISIGSSVILLFLIVLYILFIRKIIRKKRN